MPKSLLEKLGHRPGMGALVWRAPGTLQAALAAAIADVSSEPQLRIAFVKDRAELADAASAVAAAYAPGGRLWICYPKSTGRLRTDLTRDRGWEPIEALGFLGVAQVAVDETWSALRFRLRDEIRVVTRRSPSRDEP